MIIGDRLREMREAKKLSQGDIEKRTTGPQTDSAYSPKDGRPLTVSNSF